MAVIAAATTLSSVLTDIGTVLTSAISWVGDTVSAVFSDGGALQPILPFLCIGLGLGVLAMGVKYVRSFIKL